LLVPTRPRPARAHDPSGSPRRQVQNSVEPGRMDGSRSRVEVRTIRTRSGKKTVRCLEVSTGFHLRRYSSTGFWREVVKVNPCTPGKRAPRPGFLSARDPWGGASLCPSREGGCNQGSNCALKVADGEVRDRPRQRTCCVRRARWPFGGIDAWLAERPHRVEAHSAGSVWACWG